MYKFHTNQKDCSFQYFCGFSYLLCKTPNRSDGLLYPLILYGTTHLCKLSNRPGGLFYLLALLRLVYLLCKLPNRPDIIFYPLALSRLVSLLCKTPNRSDRLFYPLTFDGSTICNQLGLGDEHRHGIYVTKILAVV